MIYSLITNPAAATFQLVKGTGQAIVVAVILGTASGTVIVMVSSGFVLLAAII